MSDSDLRPESTDALERRLARFFTLEVARAEEDLRDRPIHPRAAGRPAVRLAGLLAAAGVVVVAVLVGSILPSTAPRLSPSPGSPAPGSVGPTPPPATASPTPGIADRYPDGIPRIIGGEPVLRPAEAVRRARESGSDARILAGGWWSYSDFPFSCPMFRDEPLLPRCPTAGLADVPAATHFWALALPDGVILPGREGPFVLAIHAHDRRAAECDSAVRAECEQTAVVDAVVWAGDEQTRTKPLTISQVVRQLRLTNQSISVAPGTAPNPCEVPWPPQTWEVTGDARLGTVAVFPTVAEREVAQPKLGPDSFFGEKCDLIIDRFGPAHWEIVENVMVLVTRDDPAFVRSVVHALEGGLESADGIPRWIDGAPVFRPTEAVEVARGQTDDTPFLLGGWYEVYWRRCPLRPSGQPTSPLLPWCNGVMLVETPGSGAGATLVFLRGVEAPPQGPVVLRVHVHDPLARECDPSIRGACEQAIVVEAVVWTTDP